jgi:hypothetical protein
MKAFQIFTHDINKLVAFYKATIYSYDQTEEVLNYRGTNKIPYDITTTDGLLIKQPHFFKYKRSAKIELRKNLCEIVFVRLVSSLEVFLIDLVRDAFLESKEPFKKQDVIPKFSQSELLSFKSTTEISAKIINKECRNLSNGGFVDIIKYYKKYFDIDIACFAPGKSKMEEYHDRRHLLVHRLGKTDQQFREKYNSLKQGITIDEPYLFECVADFTSFAEMVNNQMNYQLLNEFTQNSRKIKAFERRLMFQIETTQDSKLDCIDPNFEFWANDEFSNFSDILDYTKEIGENKTEFIISGSFRQIKSYMRILRRLDKQKLIILNVKDIEIEEKKVNVKNSETREFITRILDDEILTKIQNMLPAQPWETGIHKIVAAKLDVSNKLVTMAIKQLISKGIFKNQIDGQVIEYPLNNKETKEIES